MARLLTLPGGSAGAARGALAGASAPRARRYASPIVLSGVGRKAEGRRWGPTRDDGRRDGCRGKQARRCASPQARLWASPRRRGKGGIEETLQAVPRPTSVLHGCAALTGAVGVLPRVSPRASCSTAATGLLTSTCRLPLRENSCLRDGTLCIKIRRFLPAFKKDREKPNQAPPRCPIVSGLCLCGGPMRCGLPVPFFPPPPPFSRHHAYPPSSIPSGGRH